MGVLLIDGEYYRKFYSVDRLQELVKKFLGTVTYPSKIIYFGAQIDNIREKLNNVKNLEINDEGYISIHDGGRRVQKGVDGYIVKELMLLSQDSNVDAIYLIAGDGDLIAGIDYAKQMGKNPKVISGKENTSKKIEKLVDVYYLQDYLNDDIVNEPYPYALSENILNLKKMWMEKRDDKGWLSATLIGQLKNKYKFKYEEKLKILLNQLEEVGIIKQQKESRGPGNEISFN